MSDQIETANVITPRRPSTKIAKKRDITGEKRVKFNRAKAEIQDAKEDVEDMRDTGAIRIKK